MLPSCVILNFMKKTPSKNIIKGILFDWAGVFCRPGEPFASKKLQKKLDLKPAQIEKQVEDFQKKYYRGEISAKIFWRKVLNHFELKNLPIEELNRSYLQSYKIYPSMFLLVKKLKEEYEIGLVSNLTNEMLRDIESKNNLRIYFSSQTFSNKTGYLKPEPEIFNLALKKLGTQPKETLFIDDSKINILAAQQLGMITVLATTPRETIRKIKEILSKSN